MALKPDFPFRVTAANDASAEDNNAAWAAEAFLRYQWEHDSEFRDRYASATHAASKALTFELLYGVPLGDDIYEACAACQTAGCGNCDDLGVIPHLCPDA